MPGQNVDEFARYECLRMELAQVAYMLMRGEASFPGTVFQFVEGDTCVSWKQWDAWISKNRSTRGDDLESWDIYPVRWILSRKVYSKRNGTNASGLCGRYFRSHGDATAARRELERLATRGAKILYALRTEKNRKGGAIIPEDAYLAPGGPGYRVFLDAVRNTAEIYRNALLNVEHGLWGVPQHMKAEAAAIGRSMARRGYAIDRNKTPPLDFGTTEIRPGIFLACANAVRFWLETVPPNPLDEYVMYHFETMRLPATCSPDKALAFIGVASVKGGTGAERPKRRGRKPAPPEVQKEEDRLYRLHMKPEYKYFEHMARALNLKEGYIRKCCENARKRRARHRARRVDA